MGELTRDVHPDDLKTEFKEFGRIRDFQFKGRYAFIEYEESGAAETAVDRMDNERMGDCRLRVEFASKLNTG